MFFHQRILKGVFNRYYLLKTSADGMASGWNTRSVDLYGRAKSFVQQLDVSDSYWRELLYTQSHIDLRHVQLTDEELVAELLHSGRISAYEVPGPEETKRLASCTVTDKKTGVSYMFLSQNASLIMNVTHRRAFNSTKETEDFLKIAALDEKQVNKLLSCRKDQPPSRLNAHQRLVQALMSGTLMVSVAPPSSPAKPKSVQTEDLAHVAQPVSLGPHKEAGYVPPVTKAKPPPAVVEQTNQPAQSLEECEQRLEAARERLKSQGYQPKYTDEDMLTLADKGELDDRFVVRFMESKYVTESGYLGRKDGDSLKYWSTTFNQLENADSDPKTICGVLGIDYDPAKSYTLLIVDTQGVAAGQATNIVPTYKKLGEFAKTEVAGLNSSHIDQVMTPQYSKKYAELMKEFNEEGNDLHSDEDIKDFANRNIDEFTLKNEFVARAKIHSKLGANEHFTGDGTTKCLLLGNNKCGVMETFTYDKNPQTLGTMQANGSLRLKPTVPV